VIAGKRDHLARKIRKSYGISKDAMEKQRMKECMTPREIA